MSFIAERMSQIDASGIRKVFALAAKMTNPINLSIGQPDYDVDELVKDKAVEKIRAGFNSYTQTWGIDELREACSVYYQKRFGVPLDNVMITSGVSGGLFLALMATVNPGDEVICADPYFVMYKHLVNLLGGKSVPVDTYPDFKLKAEAVEAAITEKTKILIVNAPANPTGVTMAREDLAALAAVAKKHNLLVLSDEIYEQLQYDTPPATIVGMYDNVLLLNGFSKMSAMTGWRVGYAAGPEEIIQKMNTLQQYTFVCAPSFAQHAAVVALGLDHSAKVDAYRAKRDIIYEGLREKFNPVKPGGAFYIFPPAPGGDGMAFVQKAIQNNVLIIPGNVFSERNTHFRISFAAPNATLEKGIEVLNRLADEM
ncbi:MAG: aspartate aminotransferase [Candidatus Hydrogenedentes bacterium]|nr:aspartate aminotransferase [Candidatus Hydrogenedentota bacterium]